MAFIHPNHKTVPSSVNLLSIFWLICNAPSKICNSLRICREVACSVALIPSVYEIKHGLCEGIALGGQNGKLVLITHGGFHLLFLVHCSVIARTFPNMAGGRNEDLFHYVKTELNKMMKKVC